MSFIRTDLAVEAAEAFADQLPDGVEMTRETPGGVAVTRVVIRTAQAAERLGRVPGQYVTLELPSTEQSVSPADEVTRAVAEQLTRLLPAEGPVLVVGLGNRQITPDALGPEVLRQIFATRHIPAEVAKQTGLEGLRAVSAIAPGVLGQTGIETGEIVRAIVRDTKPVAVVVIDALASRSLARLGRTIQLASCGISPGSGVANARKQLSEETLGVPVISVGIPTVVDGATLACELLGREDCKLAPEAAQMMVTPRDIDAIIARGAKYLSLAINCALHPRLSAEELSYLVS